MRFKNFMTMAAAGTMLAVVPTTAVSATSLRASQAVPTASVERAGAQTTEESNLRGGAGLIIAILAAAAVIAGIIIAADNNDSPTSA